MNNLLAKFVRNIKKPHFAAFGSRFLCGNSTLHNHSKPTHSHKQRKTTTSLLFSAEDGCYQNQKRFYMLQHEDDDRFERGILVNPQLVSLELPDNLEFTQLVGSSGGLLCLAGDRSTCDPVHVCNPVTGEYVKLPEAKCFKFGAVSGFGFIDHCNWYNVLRMVRYPGSFETNLITELYTVGFRDLYYSGTWRPLGVAPYPLRSTVLGQVYLDECFHWLIHEPCLIMSFSVLESKFFAISLPAKLVSRMKQGNYMRLMDLGGRLCVVDHSFHDRVEIWVQVCKGRSNWTKKYVIPRKGEKGFRKYVYPVKLMKNGNVLLHVREPEADILTWYDPITKVFRDLDIGKLPWHRDFNVITHTRSSVSLSNMFGHTNGNLKEEIVV